MFKLATVETPQNLPVTPSIIGGLSMASMTIPLLPQFSSCVMRAAAIVLVTISSKEDLQRLANDLGLEIRIAHYPPYTSKYNPIEHRLFAQISRTCRGAILSSLEAFSDLIAQTSTKTGLSVISTIIDAVYETGRKASDSFKTQMPIRFDHYLPQWNYVAQPQQL